MLRLLSGDEYVSQNTGGIGVGSVGCVCSAARVSNIGTHGFQSVAFLDIRLLLLTDLSTRVSLNRLCIHIPHLRSTPFRTRRDHWPGANYHFHHAFSRSSGRHVALCPVHGAQSTGRWTGLCRVVQLDRRRHGSNFVVTGDTVGEGRGLNSVPEENQSVCLTPGTTTL